MQGLLGGSGEREWQEDSSFFVAGGCNLLWEVAAFFQDRVGVGASEAYSARQLRARRTKPGYLPKLLTLARLHCPLEGSGQTRGLATTSRFL